MTWTESRIKSDIDLLGFLRRAVDKKLPPSLKT